MVLVFDFVSNVLIMSTTKDGKKTATSDVDGKNIINNTRDDHVPVQNPQLHGFSTVRPRCMRMRPNPMRRGDAVSLALLRVDDDDAEECNR